MEPFGLLSFLQNLLQKPDSDSNPDAAPTPAAPPPESDSEHPQRSDPTENEYSRDAVLRFMESHDRRVKRSKKP